MKTLAIALIVTIVLREIHCSVKSPVKKPSGRIGDKVNLYAVKEKLIDAYAHVKSKAGNAYVNMSRVLNYTRLRFDSWLRNRDFILGKADAAHFFQDEQKVRDEAIVFMEEELARNRQKRDEARPSFLPWKWGWSIPGLLRSLWRAIQWVGLNRKIGKMKGEVASGREIYNEEFFCEDENPISLELNCRRALRNEKLQERISMKYIDSEKLTPVCDMKSVYLPETGFKSVRRFLICPVVAYKVHSYKKTPLTTYAYITSVENPSKYRMRYYLFMSPDLDLAVELPEPVLGTPPEMLYPPPYPPYPPAVHYPYSGYHLQQSPPRDPKHPPPYDSLPPPQPGYPVAYYSPPQTPPYSSPSSPDTDSSSAKKASHSPPSPEAWYHPPPSAPFASSRTFDSPPRDVEKSSRASNSPPHSPPPTSEDVNSASSSPKNEQQQQRQTSKKGWFWFNNKSGKDEDKSENAPEKKKSEKKKSKKEAVEKPLQIVTLVINRDYHAYEKKKRV